MSILKIIAFLPYILAACKNTENPLLRGDNCEGVGSKKEKLKITTVSCGFGKRDVADVFEEDKNCLDMNSVANFGEDASFLFDSDDYSAFSIADGVGGWNRQGIDPSVFSFNLEKNILDQLKAGMDATSLLRLTNRSYNKIKSEDVIHGSATLTSLSIDKINHVLYTSNLGDSGFIIIRSGAIYDLSSPQQHFFNAPFQLANAPRERKNAMRDKPELADFKNMVIKSGDIILAFSDGVSDNLFEYELRTLMLEMLPDLSIENWIFFRKN